jgi:hypothetical protein
LREGCKLKAKTDNLKFKSSNLKFQISNLLFERVLHVPGGDTTKDEKERDWRAGGPARRAAPQQSGVKPPHSKIFFGVRARL